MQNFVADMFGKLLMGATKIRSRKATNRERPTVDQLKLAKLLTEAEKYCATPKYISDEINRELNKGAKADLDTIARLLARKSEPTPKTNIHVHSTIDQQNLSRTGQHHHLDRIFRERLRRIAQTMSANGTMRM